MSEEVKLPSIPITRSLRFAYSQVENDDIAPLSNDSERN